MTRKRRYQMDFKDIWEDQMEFNSNFFDQDTKNDKEKFANLNNFYHLAAHRELSEVLETTNWKIHRQENKKTIRSNTLEELIDVLKYWMSIAQLHGFSPEEITEEYWRKSTVVEQRYTQERLSLLSDPKNGGHKIVAVDIDGVLADYPLSFVRFINKEMGTRYDVKDVCTYDIYSDLGISKQTGLVLKDKYRQFGMKRYIPVIEGAKEFLESLKGAGYTVVLLTSRPYKEYYRIYADTMEWLKRNGLPYDYLIFNEKKEEYLLELVDNQNIAFFVDDVEAYSNKVSDLGIKAYLVTRPYNKGRETSANVTRINNLQEIEI